MLTATRRGCSDCNFSKKDTFLPSSPQIFQHTVVEDEPRPRADARSPRPAAHLRAKQPKTTRFLGQKCTEQRKKTPKKRPNCHFLAQTGTKPSTTSHTTRNSARILQLHNLLPHSLQLIFTLNMSSPPQKKPHLGFQRSLTFLPVRYYCISLSLESFIWDYTHVPKHSCSTSWLLSFFPREKPASIRHPISCSLSKGCSGFSSA